MSDEDREARRAERRAEREERRAERHRIRAEMRTQLGDAIRERIHTEIGEGLRKGAKKWYFGFGDMGPGAHGERAEATEVVEKRFQVGDGPRLRVNNVSGETEITVGSPNEVFIRARKRVHGWSEERARRLLDNVEVRMEQDGDEILVEPRLFQQERAWMDLFRGGRVAVDLDIRVPRETHVDASTVSGDVEFDRSRVRTPDVVTVSGDVTIQSLSLPEDGEGRVKTVSGDIDIVL